MTGTATTLPKGIEIRAPLPPEFAEILTQQALNLLATLERAARPTRAALLADREQRQQAIHNGQMPQFLPETEAIRNAAWQVAPTPPDLQERHVEITGPTDAKMIINALNSGASVFMADFEDANCPTWRNMLEGQRNLRAAVRRSLTYTAPDGRAYRLNPKTAVLMVRPRGWHLDERHLWVDGAPMSGALFDFGLYLFHNAQTLLQNGSGPYFYLAKLESHHEARLWNEMFNLAQDHLGIARGSIRATVLIETILAAFEMDEILYELRDHAAGLNAGRWDYIFSIIKKFRSLPNFVLPDRAQITMTVPFMRAYTELLVQTCHKRGAHAIGGMAAYIPSRKDAEVNERALQKVREDKLRESQDGFDGTWVAHPDLVAVAREIFDGALGDRPHQKERLRPEVRVIPAHLTDFRVPKGRITENGIRLNINVALQYLAAWLNGNGAVAIYNLMEDTATAEISRSQLWQWLHNPTATMEDNRRLTPELYRSLLVEEQAKIQAAPGNGYAQYPFGKAETLLNQLVLDPQFTDFLTIPGSEYLD